MAAIDRRREVRQVVPEPHHDVAELLGLRRPIELGEGEGHPGEHAVVVHEHPVGSRPHAVEHALAHEMQLDVGAVGQDREHEVIVAEVLEEEGVAQLRDQALAVVDDLVEVIVGHDRVQIEVRMLVSLTRGRRAREERRHDPFVAGAGGDETIEDDLAIALPRGVTHAPSLAWSPSEGQCVSDQGRSRHPRSRSALVSTSLGAGRAIVTSSTHSGWLAIRTRAPTSPCRWPASA